MSSAMKKIALLIETSRTFGREFLNGIAKFAQSRRSISATPTAGFSVRRLF